MEAAKNPASSSFDDLYQYDDSFRDSIATVDEEGKRIWIYPKKPSGTWHNRRVLVTVILLAVFFIGPFIQIDGRPFLLLNVFERKFILFGAAFWPQDFYLLALTSIAFFVFVIFFTVTFGRIWCGWACPQTLFMEMVFRKIEYWIEGDAAKQRKLDAGPWNREKVVKKGSKHLIYIGFSLLISHTVMAYLLGLDETVNIISQGPAEHASGFIGLMAFTGVFYWVFSYFREQACTVVCPYGRLQGVLLVKESIVVAYDWIRGEPRGRIKKGVDMNGKGDCVDCKLCVHVCPTGIDIRHGTQLECVNCTACMDACDQVMEKVGKPKGLIRYTSYTSIKEGINKIFTTRVVAYSVVLIGLLTLLSFLIVTRTDIEGRALRAPGTRYQKTEDGMFMNVYNIQVLNKTFDPMQVEIKLISPEGATIQQVGGSEVIAEGGEKYEGVFIVKIPPGIMHHGKNPIEIGFYSMEGQLIDKVSTSFMGPMPGQKL